ncbi:MAG: hypothetical protein ACD_58C00287G0010 [uncultured bacterium]|nr:MAG: hypothetical protein ACD_58C00287G0010 [uncultured bacterium]
MLRLKIEIKIIGTIDIESWANPKTYSIDFQMENGNTKVEERDNLEYIGIEEV